MADFVSRSVVKSAVRTLATPIATLAAFEEVVDDILTSNPFGCTAYESGGVSHQGIEKTRESYTARFIVEDAEAQTIGTIAVRNPTSAAYTANIATVNATAALRTNMSGANLAHATDDDSFTATIRCHDASGELYNVAITRTAVTVSGYEADAILTAVEAWADATPALA